MRVLLADDDAVRARDLARALAADPAVEVVRLLPGESLVGAVARHAPGVVVMDMSRPDRDALEGVRRVTAAGPRPIVLFVDEDDPKFMEEAILAGVCSYHVGSVAPPDVRPILRAAASLFRLHEQTRAALRGSEARLRERVVIDQAKGVLMRERRLTEPQAYRWLQRRAMAGGRRIADIAGEIVTEQAGPGE